MRQRFVLAAALVVLMALFAWPEAASARDWPGWLQPCGSSERCGTLRVPLDRADPEGRTIGLHVKVLPAAAANGTPSEAFFAVAGGPGGASTEMAEWAALALPDIRLREDIVLVDQRGTGLSGPLFCPFPGLISEASPADRVRQYWAACLGDLAADPRHYTTAVAADDLDDVRAALGYERIDLYGISYGATAAQYYLLRHGDRVRTVTLDGATTLDVPVFERWAANGQRVLDRLFRRCSAQRACRRAFPAPARDLRTLLARLDRKPARVGDAVIDRHALATTIQQLSRSPETVGRIPLLLRRALARGLTAAEPLVRDLPLGRPPVQQLMSMAIMCLEPWARQDPDRIAATASASYLGPTVVRTARWAAAVCSAMPLYEDVPGADALVPSSVPALVLVGGEDPQDPLANVAGITRAMPNARIAVVRYGGHGVLGVGCSLDLLNAFVLRGRAAGMDLRCAARTPAPAFVLP
jgi:pimeloyl-ACP methyl ester carboxylesterase